MAKGLDGRERDENGEIRRKNSNAINRNLSHPIKQFRPDATVDRMREVTGEIGLENIRKAIQKIRGK